MKKVHVLQQQTLNKRRPGVIIIIFQEVTDMFFKRKAYDKLVEWKNKYADHYAVLLEGARRVGK